MKNRTKFSEFMTVISEMHEKTPSNLLIEVYWRVLKPFTDDQCQKAFDSVINGCKFFPKPAEIVEFITGSSKQIEQSIDEKALVIANEIIAHLHAHGSRTFPKLNDPIAKYLMTKRWPYYEWSAAVIEDELKWWTKEFCEAYKSYLAMENITMPLLDSGKEDIKKLVQNIAQVKDEPTVCVRCDRQCRPAVSQNPYACLFKRALQGLCPDCVVTQLLLSVEISRLVIERHGLKVLLNPGIQDQFVKIMCSGKSEMSPDEINWKRVIVNWNEPFPKGYEPKRIAV